MELKKVSTFSNRLNEALKINGLSITAFAKKISYSKQAISAYIKGTRSPKRPVIMLMASTLNVSEAWLCGYDVPQSGPISNDVSGNNTVYIVHDGESMQYELTDAEIRAVLILLNSIKRNDN